MRIRSWLIGNPAVSVSTEESGYCEFFIGDNHKTRTYYDSTSRTHYEIIGGVTPVCINLSAHIKRSACPQN